MASTSDISSAEALITEGLSLYEEEKYEEALTTFRSALKACPQIGFESKRLEIEDLEIKMLIKIAAVSYFCGTIEADVALSRLDHLYGGAENFETKA